jgi:hypothetical protein
LAFTFGTSILLPPHTSPIAWNSVFQMRAKYGIQVISQLIQAAGGTAVVVRVDHTNEREVAGIVRVEFCSTP